MKLRHFLYLRLGANKVILNLIAWFGKHVWIDHRLSHLVLLQILTHKYVRFLLELIHHFVFRNRTFNIIFNTQIFTLKKVSLFLSTRLSKNASLIFRSNTLPIIILSSPHSRRFLRTKQELRVVFRISEYIAGTCPSFFDCRPCPGPFRWYEKITWNISRIYIIIFSHY